MSIKVAIFDDDPKFLDAILMLMEEATGMELTGAYQDTTGFIGRLRKATPDIVLMDIGIAPVNGIEATKEIVEHFPGTKVLIQTVFEEDQKVFGAICAGASGYVLKSGLPSVLQSSIREVHEGGAFMSPPIARKILSLFQKHFPKSALQQEYNLSRREKEVLKYLVEGYSYKMIADKCTVSYETIRTYIKRIYEKLHVASMTEAVAKAIFENLF
jgi:DNA-binding NarL/FixJ family response regulator